MAMDADHQLHCAHPGNADVAHFPGRTDQPLLSGTTAHARSTMTRSRPAKWSLANVQFDCLVGLTVLLGVVNPTGAAPALTNQAQVLSIEGANFLVSRAGSIAWDPGYVGQSLNAGDRGRTGERTRLRLRLSSLSILTVDEFSEFLIEAGATPAEPSLFQLVKARLYMLGRDKRGIGRFKSKAANAATRGTEFTVEVEETTGRMGLLAFDR